MEIIHLVEHLSLSIRRTPKELGNPRSTFYRWYIKYQEEGFKRLAGRKSDPSQFWNRIPDYVRLQVVDLALGFPDKSPRQIG
jgi:putative transposase